LADFRLGTHYGLKSDIARGPNVPRTDIATKEYHVRIPTNVDTAARSPSGRPDRAASGLPGWQIEAGTGDQHNNLKSFKRHKRRL
jgi:hypothetical protein